MDEKMVIRFTGKVVPQAPINEQLTLCKCYVMAIGKNRNKTNISKNASDNALPSLYNIPVVGHIYVGEDGSYQMGGHDMALEKNSDGSYKFRVLTVPYGVVPIQDNAHYEDIEEADGSVKTYLVADIILWTGRYPELLDAAYSKEVYYAQSMEINPIKKTKRDDYLDIEEYQYSALCLLGKSDDKEKNVEPCFEQSRVEPYSFSNEEGFYKLLKEFKDELVKCYSRNSTAKGGNTLDIENNKNDLKEEESVVGISDDDGLSDSTENLNEADDNKEECLVDDVNEDEGAKEERELEDVVEPAKNDEDPRELRFAVELTYEEKRKALQNALVEEDVWNENEYTAHWLLDFDNRYAYCKYRHCSVENNEEKNVRIPYEYDSESASIKLNVDQKEDVRLIWATKEDEEKLLKEKQMLKELAEYKRIRLEDDRRREFGAIIDEFKDLSEIDEYRETVRDAMIFENAETLRERLYAIRGKNMKISPKKPISQLRIPVGDGTQKTNTELDEFMSRYLSRKKIKK